VPPSTSNIFSFFSWLWSKSDSQVSKYCVVCEISWCRCQQLTALSISTALVTELLVIEQLLHLALKFAVSAPWPTFLQCPSRQRILVTPLRVITSVSLQSIVCLICRNSLLYSSLVYLFVQYCCLRLPQNYNCNIATWWMAIWVIVTLENSGKSKTKPSSRNLVPLSKLHDTVSAMV